jgi:hypothetical protein
LSSHSFTLDQRRFSLENRPKSSNSSSVGAHDVQNFIGQVHLTVFYIIIGIPTALCVAIFLLECAMQNAQALSIFILNKFKHYSLKFLFSIVCSLSLMNRLIGRLCHCNCNPPRITLKRARIEKIYVNKIHKIDEEPEQQ